MRYGLRTASLAVTAIVTVTSALAEPGQSDCFFISQFQQWRAPDAKTIFIRVNMNQYYRLDLAGECPLLTAPDVHLITKTRGPDTVCSALDWDLSAAQSPPGGFAVPCIVKQMTKLSTEEIAAIPPKFKP